MLPGIGICASIVTPIATARATSTLIATSATTTTYARTTEPTTTTVCSPLPRYHHQDRSRHCHFQVRLAGECTMTVGVLFARPDLSVVPVNNNTKRYNEQ